MWSAMICSRSSLSSSTHLPDQEGAVRACRSVIVPEPQIGIEDAARWTFARRRDVLNERFLRGLHRRMFGDVWRWAGDFSTTARNIGIDAYSIGIELRQLTDDVRFWIDNGSYPAEEIAVRFHHRIVAIHPFPNGNGRLSRLAADLLAVQLGLDRFSWGSANLIEARATRKIHVEALRAADRHDMAPLLTFVRS
ncbi:mobile mystery protein B [Sphingomonas crocodyli]|uniref:Mobile mystery protein B n=1 Tax=Sphingomonas crocodyli TaxID=1979270 RepID=A0A437LY65_9SPHN|nr:mobile mystery protein B [Sphingomonas crocodyli]RVT90317.1 mobile mystery protein B [Sphingomonas crocodyli]